MIYTRDIFPKLIDNVNTLCTYITVSGINYNTETKVIDNFVGLNVKAYEYDGKIKGHRLTITPIWDELRSDPLFMQYSVKYYGNEVIYTNYDDICKNGLKKYPGMVFDSYEQQEFIYAVRDTISKFVNDYNNFYTKTEHLLHTL